MIRYILILTAVLMLITLALVWLLTGGWGKITHGGINFANPIDIIFFHGTTTGGHLVLPWQLSITQGPDISQYVDEANRETGNTSSDIESTQDQYSAPPSQPQELQTFGNPSPYRGKVLLGAGAVTESNIHSESIELRASSQNTTPVAMTGWTLQSAVTGVRMNIPPAASPFLMGVVNAVDPLSLAPGEDAIVVSGPSPVGVSFRENICTGYLQQFQNFTPPLNDSCPDPSDAFPASPENIQKYGDSCFDFVRSLPHCTFPNKSIPSGLSQSCVSFVLNTYNYSSCVSAYRQRPDFKLDTWRIYLSSGVELWRNTHDIIRLLDAQGRTVDVVSY